MGCAFVGNTVADGEGTAVCSTVGNNTSLFANSLFCGDQFDAITGPWIDKGGNVFDENCDQDCDGDGLPDGYEIANGLEADCNGNGLPDSCEAGGDCDDDGILDEAEPVAIAAAGGVPMGGVLRPRPAMAPVPHFISRLLATG